MTRRRAASSGVDRRQIAPLVPRSMDEDQRVAAAFGTARRHWRRSVPAPYTPPRVAANDAHDVLEHRARPGRGRLFVGRPAVRRRAPRSSCCASTRPGEPALAEMPLEALLDELLVRTKEILDVDTVAIS